jgi:hypothetical protein
VTRRQTQIVRVLRALQQGCRTAAEIAAYAKFDGDGRGGKKIAAAYLYALHKSGCIEKTGAVTFGEVGRNSYMYKLLPRGEAELRRRLNHGGRLR